MLELNQFNPSEEITDTLNIVVDDIVVVNCFASQTRGRNFNYIINVTNESLYKANKESCDMQIQDFLEKIVSIQNSDQTSIEKKEEVSKYKLI